MKSKIRQFSTISLLQFRHSTGFSLSHNNVDSKHMTKLVSSFNITVDGFCDHLQSVDDNGHNLFANDLLRQSGAVLFGRTTYQLFEAFWPKAAVDPSLAEAMQEFGQLIDEAQKIVVSNTLSRVTWKHSRLISSIDKTSVENLKQEFPKGLLMFGSPALLETLTKEQTIDDYYFSIQPLIGGKGKRLFGTKPLELTQSLSLVGTRHFPAGITTLHFQKNDRDTQRHG